MKSVSAILVLLGLGAGSAFAHHSFAMFDMSAEKKLVGTVKEMQWTNPHIWVQVLVMDDKTGKAVEWSIEGGSPNGLSRAGWKRSSIKAGDAVEVTIHPLKDGTNGGSLMRIVVNGQPVGGPPPGGAPPADAKPAY
jgi:hypothetical protein